MTPALSSSGTTRCLVFGLAAYLVQTAALQAAPPPNDNFAGRIALIGPTNQVTGSSVNATKEAGEPQHLKIPTGASVWWSWTAPDNGPVTISTAGSSYDTALAVYTGSQLTNLSLVAENDDVDGGVTSRVEFQAAAGTEYQILIDGFLGDNGSVALSVLLPIVPSAPSILGQPQSLAFKDMEGSNATFSVVAAGSLPLQYQWQFKGTNLPGATQPQLTVTNVGLANAGIYAVVVSNAWGTATSSNAVLSVATVIVNDNFANRFIFTGATNVASGTTVNATREPGEPRHLKMPTGASLWWSWTAPESGPVSIDTQGSEFDTALAVYTGSAVNALTLVAQNDDADGAITSRVQFNAVGGVAYQIAVDGMLGAAGPFMLTESMAVVPSAPAITNQPANVTVGDGGINDAVFSVGLTGSYPRYYQWSFNGTNIPGANGPDLAVTKITQDNAGLYSVTISNGWGVAASSSAMLKVVTAMPNDYFGNRIFLSGASNYNTASLLGATKEPGEPNHAGQPGGHSLWWRWIAPASGPVEMHLIGTNFTALLLAAYTGNSVDRLTNVASATNTDLLSDQPHALIQFEAAAGVSYQIAVDGEWDDSLPDSGGIALQIVEQVEIVKVPNDNFADRFVFSGATNTMTGSNANASREPGEPNHLGLTVGASVWWSWVAPDTGPVNISTFGSDFDTVMAVYTGDSVDNLTLVAQNDDSEGITSAVNFNAVGGTAYQIAVDGLLGANGNIQLNVALPVSPSQPVVTDQPASQTLVGGMGSNAIFNVSVTGSYPRFYQWQRDGSDLPGATNAQLVIPEVTLSDSGVYSVAVSNVWGGAISSNAVLTIVEPLENDFFAGRIPIEGTSNTVSGSNVGATHEDGEPVIAGNPGGWSVWWSWIAPGNGLVRVSTEGSSFDTILGIYNGDSVTNLTLVTEGDDSGDRHSNVTSVVYFRALAGTEYQIAVDGYNNTNGIATVGDITLSVQQYADNDFFANRLVASPEGGSNQDSNVGATKEPGEPHHDGSPGGHSVWWSWTPTSSGPVVIDTQGSTFDTLLAVYTGSSVDNLAVVDEDDTGLAPGVAHVRFSAVAGTEYIIAIDGETIGTNADSGDIVFTISRNLTGNDNFADRIALSGQTNQVLGSNVGASKESDEPDHAGNPGGRSVWWSWVAPLSGPVTISTLGSDVDTLLAVYVGSDVSALTLAAQNDDYLTNLQSQVQFDAVAGTEYEIAVDGFRYDSGADSGQIVLSLAQPTPPSSGGNDNFSGRFTITGSTASVLGSNASATKEQGEPNHAGNLGGASVWWSWVAPVDGAVTIDTIGSSFDTILGVYTGLKVANLTRIASDDDAAPNGRSSVTFVAVAGTEYEIAVDGFNNGDGPATGGVELNLLQYPQGPLMANDNFDSRTTFLPFLKSVTGFNIGATREQGEPHHHLMPDGASVWWSWTASANGAVSIDTFGSQFDTVLSVYTGSDLTNLSLVAENDDAAGNRQSRVRFEAMAGTEYQIAVDGYAMSIGPIVLNISPDPDSRRAPQVTQNPADQTRLQNGSAGGSTNVVFRVVATGSAPMSFQWQVNQTNIPGATNPVYTVTNVMAGDEGSYRVRITNSVGKTFSAPATLRIVTNTFNDFFADRIAIVGQSNTLYGSCFDATREPGEPNHNGLPGGESVWWSWVAPSNGPVTISTIGSSFDTYLAVYTGSSISNLTLLVGNDDLAGTNSGPSLVQFQAEAGIEYQMVVDAYKTNQLSRSIVLNLYQPAVPPRIMATIDLDGKLTAFPQLEGFLPFTSYQWYLGGEAIPGADQATLVLTNFVRSMNGLYSLVLSNSYGAVTSSITLKTVQRLRPLVWSTEGRVQLYFSDLDGTLAPDPVHLHVQFTTALQGADTVWETREGEIMQMEGLYMFEDFVGESSARLYRVVEDDLDLTQVPQ